MGSFGHLDRIPLETQEGLNEIQGIVPALLLNLPRDEFTDAMGAARAWNH